jgi:hypothetical protein
MWIAVTATIGFVIVGVAILLALLFVIEDLQPVKHKRKRQSDAVVNTAASNVISRISKTVPAKSVTYH